LLKLPFPLGAVGQRASSFAIERAIATQCVASRVEPAVKPVAASEAIAQITAKIAAIQPAGIAEPAARVAAELTAAAPGKRPPPHAAASAASAAASFSLRHDDDHRQASHGERRSD
jgi:hypothetical protein